jgi:DNA helicase IV
MTGPHVADPAATDEEVGLEQRALDRAGLALGAMRDKAETLLQELRAAGRPDLDYEAALKRRVYQLGDGPRPLLFGRIDESAGESWRIGRRHVEEAGGDVLVVDWRAPISVPFYRARPGDAYGLARRRQIMVEVKRVLAVADDLFDAQSADAATTRLRGGDALLLELERARTGEMLDIVATIQAEQDEIIRGPLEGLVVVQGGPGTGKTAVGLHRAAFLLYNHPELVRSGVLVIGPTRAFLRYIAQVLPSLGEEAVVQTTISDVAPRVRTRGTDSPEAAVVKGDARMATVIERALALERARLSEPVRLRVRHLSGTLEPDEVNQLVAAIAATKPPYKAGRGALRSRLVSLVRQRFRASGRYEADEDWFAKELAASAGFSSLLDRLWPAVSPHQLVADLLSRPKLLRAAAQGVLSDGEAASLVRPPAGTLAGVPWTSNDLALLDEASFLINGRTRRYGHVICDEAQDLSPMQFRMVARRATAGSVTVLGDIAQATGPSTYETWDDVLPHLPPSTEVRREELTLGYRAPAQVLDLASRLLPFAAPAIRPTTSVRTGRFPPEVIEVTEESLATEALAAGLRHAALGYLVGLIVPEGELAARVAAAARHEPTAGRLDDHGITRAVTVVPAPQAKGLEFDAVVLVEPASIAGTDRRGLRLLYVALTRPIQRLSLVHALPLPAALGDPEREAAGPATGPRRAGARRRPGGPSRTAP